MCSICVFWYACTSPVSNEEAWAKARAQDSEAAYLASVAAEVMATAFLANWRLLQPVRIYCPSFVVDYSAAQFQKNAPLPLPLDSCVRVLRGFVNDWRPRLDPVAWG